MHVRLEKSVTKKGHGGIDIILEPKQYSNFYYFQFYFFLEFYNNLILQVLSLFCSILRKTENVVPCEYLTLNLVVSKQPCGLLMLLSYLFICTLIEVLSLMTKKAIWERALLKLINPTLSVVLFFFFLLIPI